MVSYNQHITGWYNPCSTLNNEGFFHCWRLKWPGNWHYIYIYIFLLYIHIYIYYFVSRKWEGKPSNTSWISFRYLAYMYILRLEFKADFSEITAASNEQVLDDFSFQKPATWHFAHLVILIFCWAFRLGCMILPVRRAYPSRNYTIARKQLGNTRKKLGNKPCTSCNSTIFLFLF